MQRIYIALILALTASSVLGGFNAIKFVKNVTNQVIQNTDYNFTNISGASLTLQNSNAGEASIMNANNTQSGTTPTNTSTFNWVIWYKKIDSKALTGGSNASLSVQSTTSGPSLAYGYVISMNLEIDTTANTTAIRVYQTPLSGSPLPGLTLAKNNNVSNPLIPFGGVAIGKTAYVFYLTGNDKQVNYTSFTVGGSVGTNTYTLTITPDLLSLNAIWGEALGSSSALISWTESGALKDAVIDLSKNALSNQNTVGSVVNGTKCQLYSTDKKWYGEFCSGLVTVTNNGTSTTTYNTYVRTNTSNVYALGTYQANITSLYSVEPYGPYLAVFYVNALVANTTTFSYELWNLDNLSPVANRTDFLSVDATAGTRYTQMRVPAGGIYGLIYTRGSGNDTVVWKDINVGVVLGSSYLTSILGFLMTIIAGLFLF